MSEQHGWQAVRPDGTRVGLYVYVNCDEQGAWNALSLETMLPHRYLRSDGWRMEPVTITPRRVEAFVESFQAGVDLWLTACFGETIAGDKTERNHRLLEEVLEAVQAGGCTASEAHQLVDYVFGRPVGELAQEVGGVMNTLAAFCLAYGLDMMACGDAELARVWTKIEKIRAKQAAKPKHSPLPEHATPITTPAAPAAPGAEALHGPTIEACAKVCEAEIEIYVNLAAKSALEDCAEAIRALVDSPAAQEGG